MTVPKPFVNPPSCENPLGIRKSTAHNAHDDELQRFSKRVRHSALETRGGAIGREHGEHKADKARRCSRLVRPLGDRKRDILQLHPAAASRSPRAPGPRPACPGRSPRAGALAVNAAPGSLPGQPFYTTLVRKSQQENGASERRRTLLPRTPVNKEPRKLRTASRVGTPSRPAARC
jgi:hypothetical protein